MQFNFSEQKKFSTWRRLWLFLAEAEQVLKIQFLASFANLADYVLWLFLTEAEQVIEISF